MNKFLLGIIAGAAAGLLLAPEKGTELRKDLSDEANKLSDRVRKLTKTSKKDIETLRYILKDNIEGLSDDIRHRLLAILDEASEMSYSEPEYTQPQPQTFNNQI